MPNYHLWDDYVPDEFHWSDGQRIPLTPKLHRQLEADKAQREIHETAQNCISRAMQEIGWIVYRTSDYVHPTSDTMTYRDGYYAEIERVPLEFDCTPSLELFAAGLVPLGANDEKSVIRTHVWETSKSLLSEVISITQTKFKPLPKSWYEYHQPPWLITPAQWQEDQQDKAERMRKILERQGYTVTEAA